MNILIACECSGRVRESFRAMGHNAWSCDLKPAEDGSPFHLQCDVLVAIASGHAGKDWDLVIGHPPCTFLCNSSVHLLTGPASRRPQEANRWQEMRCGAQFFLKMWASTPGRICLENPIMHHYASEIIQIEPAQMIQPFKFGDPESKSTYLWLRGLPLLQPTHSQESDLFNTLLPKPECGYWKNQTPSGNNKLAGPTAATERARTYRGIADAMADQWGKLETERI